MEILDFKYLGEIVVSGCWKVGIYWELRRLDLLAQAGLFLHCGLRCVWGLGAFFVFRSMGFWG